MNIFIVGPMGSGKSTVGKIISSELFLTFLDTDEEIETRTGASIDWIFDLEGEEGFRKRESKILDEMVKKNSIEIENKNLKFVITDFKNEIIVTFSGSVPNLFEEGKGVVAEGYLEDRKYLKAEKILAKHDENYMPPEVKEAMQGN